MKLGKLFKFKKRRIIKLSALAIIVLILALSISLFFGFRVHFIIKDELEINIDTSKKVLTLQHDEKQNITAILKTRNFRLCRINCTIEFVDLSQNKTLIKSQVNLDHNEDYQMSLPIEGNRSGEGQAIYQVNAMCSNIRSSLCRTESPKRFETKNILLQHNLTAPESAAKLELQRQIEDLRRDISKLEEKEWLAHQLLNQIHTLNSNTREATYIANKLNDTLNAIDSARKTEAELTSKWNNREYLSKPDTRALTVELNSELSEIVFIIDFEYYTITLYNNSIITLRKINEIVPLLQEASTFYNQRGSIWSQKVDKELKNFAGLKNHIKFKSFDSFAQLHEQANELQKQVEIIENKYDTDLSAALRHGAYHLTRDSLVIQKILTDWNKPQQLFGTNELISHSNFSLSQICLYIDELQKKRAELTALNKEIFSMNLTKLANTTVNKTILKEEGDLLISNLRKEADNEILAIAHSSNDAQLTDILTYKNVRNLQSFTPTYPSLFPKYYYGIIELELSQKITQFNNTYCTNLSTTSENESKEFNLEPIQIENSRKNITPAAVSDNPPLCCLFNTCYACCTEQACQEAYPIVMIHGHAFREETSPEASLHIFGLLQRRLQDAGIANGGDLELHRSLINNFWSGFNYSVSFRASYYYVRYFDIDQYAIITEKSESIENYALRLRELIDQTMKATGKTKVTLIAHSMGGLVAREYIALFGEEKVNALILIGTPNQGITEDIYNYCRLSGSKVECDDMKKGSVFLKRLNSQVNSDYTIPVYNIIGQGCNMNGFDGDGIVTVENAQLPGANALLVNGSCTGFFNVDLHNDLVNKQKTFNYIKEIIKSN